MKNLLFEPIQVRDLEIPNRFMSSSTASGHAGDTRRASCVSCNKCALALAEGKSLACYLEATL